MSVSGVIAEFNPFHNGHKYLIDALKKDGEVVCVIGDDFTQRGDISLISKYARAEAALACGADLCILMPTAWSMSCAQSFAGGGISLLKNTGIVDRVAFGSECGDIELLKKVTSAVNSDDISSLLADELKTGKTFAAARQAAAAKMLGSDEDILRNANDTLACEYIAAAKRLGFNCDFTAVRRIGCTHDNQTLSDGFSSASAIRLAFQNNNIDKISGLLPEKSLAILQREKENGRTSDITKLDTAIIAVLRTLSPEEIAKAPEISEGLENRIYSAVRRYDTLSGVITAVKSKRYTMARIRRIMLSLFLGIDNCFGKAEVPYIKVLGFNQTGEQLLKKMKPSVPIIIRGNEYDKLDGDAKLCFNLQNRASDLAALAMECPPPCGREFTEKLIKI